MNRIQQSLAVINLLRAEKDCPRARYAVLLILADAGEPVSAKYVSGKAGSQQNNLLLKIRNEGLVSMNEVGDYSLTETGVAEVRRIVDGRPNIQPASAVESEAA